MEELKKLLHKLQFDYYEHGNRLDTIIPDSDIKPILEYIKNNFVPLEAVVKPAKADKEIEKLKQALRVIYTWATFEGGIELVPRHVEKLINKLDIKP